MIFRTKASISGSAPPDSNTLLMKRLLLLTLLLRASASAADPEELAVRGQYPEAAAIFLQQAQEAGRKGKHRVAVPALLNAATCMKMSGDVSAAALHLETARKWMGPDASPRSLLEWLALKGSIQALSKRPDAAIAPLREALTLVDKHGDPALRIDLLNDLGIALSAGGNHEEAITCFAEALALSADGDKQLRARQNRLVAEFQAWSETSLLHRRSQETGALPGELATRLQSARSRLDNGIAASVALLTAAGETHPHAQHLRLTAAMAADRCGSTGLANRLYESALELAHRSGNAADENSSLLGIAEQYVNAGRHTEALRLLDEVRWQSSALPAPEAARLEILTAECRHAIAPGAEDTGNAIRRAVAAVEGIRSDLARSQYTSDLGRGFREFAGRPYLLMADHLLRKTDTDPERLRAARDAVENFKTWELNDFYRDDCVNLALDSARNLDRLEDPSVAVIYIIPLDGRTELLVSHDTGLRRFTSPTGSVDLLAAARRFRYHLESDYGTFRFLDEARLLHQSLVHPALGHLRDLKVKHLVFVMDGSLGNVPPSAFLDAERDRFLVEDFSVSIAPNLSLLAGPAATGEPRPLLACGLSVATGGFAAIPAVDAEIDGIAALYPGKVVLKNNDFTTAAIRENLLTLPAEVVHIASHGEFLGRAEECFLLTRDGRISLDQLDEMIRPKKFVGIPVGLLCLSACRTAAGDDRAALGLAGAAVKSGARSVLATLWYVEDRTTSEIMTGFHRRLRSHPEMAKAEALRQAQLEILRRDPNIHPSFWAPFILVGSWK